MGWRLYARQVTRFRFDFVNTSPCLALIEWKLRRMQWYQLKLCWMFRNNGSNWTESGILSSKPRYSLWVLQTEALRPQKKAKRRVVTRFISLAICIYLFTKTPNVWKCEANSIRLDGLNVVFQIRDKIWFWFREYESMFDTYRAEIGTKVSISAELC